MKAMKYLTIPLGLVLIAGLSALLYAKDPEGAKKNQLRKGTDNDLYLPILINNVMNYYSNTGDGSLNPVSADAEGFEMPKGSGGDVIFEDGFVMGGYQNGVKKVGGSTYFHGFQAGKVLTYGVNGTGMTADAAGATLPSGNPKYRIYRVRPDINPGTPEADVLSKLQDEVTLRNRWEPVTADDVYKRYIDDWNEWPAAQGAPYTDVNNNGQYDPGVDVPGVPGADCTMWMVMNDLDATRTFFFSGSQPIGVEIQRTIWAYNQSGALGNTIFVKNKVINVSGLKLDTTYFCQWADPDLGGSLGYNDDFVGCDTVRSLGYVYNGEPVDGWYGRAVPSGAFCFFQGPTVPGQPSDTAIFNGHYVFGKKNLKMTAFNFFVNGNATYTDPRNNQPAGTTDWYNLLQGRVTRTGAPYINPVTGRQTSFTLSGDPVTKVGWLDGSLAPPGDRRMCLVSGPFTLAAGDTQEVVVAALAAQANDYLSSVTFMKFYADRAQSAYNNFFVVPVPPKQPNVTAVPLDQEVVLSWSDSATVANTEQKPEVLGYKFEGYNVYQLPGPSFSNPKLIGTFDLADGITTIVDQDFDLATGQVIPKPLEKGTDNGVQRFVDIKTDDFTTAPLVNGTNYYFAITAYNYNGAYHPTALESAPVIVKVVPQQAKPGSQYNASYGTSLSSDTSAVHTLGGATDGYITATVVDPSSVTGHSYSVRFDTIRVNPGNVLTKVWSVVDNTTSQVKVSKVNSYGGSISDPVVDGIQYSVFDPGVAGGIKSVEVTHDASGPVTPYNILRAQSADGNWALDAAGATSTSSAHSRLNWQGLAGSNDYEIRVTGTIGGTSGGSEIYIGTGGAIGTPTTKRAPVEVWNVTTNTRLLLEVLDDDASGTYTQDATAQALSNVGIATSKDWERIYCSSAAPYTEPLPTASEGSATEILGRITFVDWNATGYFPPVGTVVKITTNKPIAPGATSFSVNTSNYAPVTGNVTLAKQTVQKINVFPNPYFGFSTLEPDRYHRFVTISHLPAKATIRVFNLAGQLLKTIVHNDPTSQFETWDLNNQSGLPVAAGVYIIHVDMPDLGTSKDLKIAVIPEQQYLDRY